MELEQELDRLYGLPLAEFVTERDALAKRARGEGENAIAGRVKALRKPTVSAWVANRLARESELDVQRLLKAGQELTKAQVAAVAGKEHDAFLRARADEQHALARLTAAGRSIIKREGIGAGTLERVTQSLRAAAVDKEARELLKRGRLTEDLEPQGFEAFARVAPKTAPKKGRAEKQQAGEARKRALEAAKRARELAKAAEAAEREADRAEETARKARTAAEKARAEADAAALKG
jgi:hypothetical protein